jgi:2-oxoglutarate dehydrogenase E2 component (dihydrolipoamide succinyltransferase)
LFKIDVAVNAPAAGTIKEFLANEEDTVTVGQDLVRLELGGAPDAGPEKPASSEPTEPASKEQPTSSEPAPKKAEPTPIKEEKKSAPVQEQPKESKPKQSEPKQSEKAPSTPVLGNRDERRVC